MAQAGGAVRVSPMWLVISYAVSELGELCLSPVGLSAVTKLAPVRILGLMMGVWFLSNAFGNKLAGWAAGFISSMPLESLFGVVAAILAGAALVMFVVVKPIRRLMGEEH
jgi:proton-dependent oligopeptide transporter, POT family